jgi:hypothetical protein
MSIPNLIKILPAVLEFETRGQTDMTVARPHNIHCKLPAAQRQL